MKLSKEELKYLEKLLDKETLVIEEMLKLYPVDKTLLSWSVHNTNILQNIKELMLSTEELEYLTDLIEFQNQTKNSASILKKLI